MIRLGVFLYPFPHALITPSGDEKNYWDDSTGWLNVYGIVQSASEKDKRDVYKFLRECFGNEE